MKPIFWAGAITVLASDEVIELVHGVLSPHLVIAFMILGAGVVMRYAAHPLLRWVKR